jgi:hypothetical protein
MTDIVSLEQLFQEELDAVLDMLDALTVVQDAYDPFDSEYYDIQNEIVKLEQTALYLTDRLSNRVPCKYISEDPDVE